jgi:hypothetical protein
LIPLIPPKQFGTPGRRKRIYQGILLLRRNGITDRKKALEILRQVMLYREVDTRMGKVQFVSPQDLTFQEQKALAEGLKEIALESRLANPAGYRIYRPYAR